MDHLGSFVQVPLQIVGELEPARAALGVEVAGLTVTSTPPGVASITAVSRRMAAWASPL